MGAVASHLANSLPEVSASSELRVNFHTRSQAVVEVVEGEDLAPIMDVATVALEAMGVVEEVVAVEEVVLEVVVAVVLLLEELVEMEEALVPEVVHSQLDSDPVPLILSVLHADKAI